jgi:hypothetical protein
MPRYRTLSTAFLACALPAFAHAAQPPAGTSYSLQVTTSFEAPFTDCWTFATNGRFIHSPSLRNFPYQLDSLNTEAGDWQAIWVGHVSIAFSGTANGSTLTGNAVDALTRTYSITGNLVPSCRDDSRLGTGWRTLK